MKSIVVVASLAFIFQACEPGEKGSDELSNGEGLTGRPPPQGQRQPPPPPPRRGQPQSQAPQSQAPAAPATQAPAAPPTQMAQRPGTAPRDPADNPTTVAKVELGRLLFWDPLLSGPGDIACASCHHPDFAYGDGLPLSVGTGGHGLGPDRVRGRGDPFVPRNAPTVLNTGFNGWVGGPMPNPDDAPMFWDNRERSLEGQALGPLQSPVEMLGNDIPENEALDRVIERLSEVPEYEALFAAAFGVAPAEAITAEHVGQAIAAFERFLSRLSSPYDQFLAGNRGALTAQQQRGLQAFNRAGCNDCHGGPMLSDYRLHRLGTPDSPATPELDTGDGQGRFRTPSLRNVALTGPYMHGGVFPDLGAVLRFYAARGAPPPGAPRPPNQGPLDRDLLDLRLNPQDIPDVIAFLRVLNDRNLDLEIPDEVPSGLPVGGDLD